MASQDKQQEMQTTSPAKARRTCLKKNEYDRKVVRELSDEEAVEAVGGVVPPVKAVSKTWDLIQGVSMGLWVPLMFPHHAPAAPTAAVTSATSAASAAKTTS